ncbi:MAG TPA: hypothetical protein VM553_23120 [Dongiaceae bacterium]|nr:hypothetical protein [Dongiaceae bacterium]
MKIIKTALRTILFTGLLACTADLSADLLREQSPLPALLESETSRNLVVQFLGAGGVFLHYGDQSLMGDPFFSNPPVTDWLLLRDLKSLPDVIDANLPPLDQVRGILVGHGHFDHAMDVPYIAQKLPASVNVYGSNTVRNLLVPELAAERLVGLDSKMAHDQKGGEWVQVSPRLRVLPIYSEHAPHFGETLMASGQVEQPLTHRPGDALDWKAGPNLNYVIDFLDVETGGEPRVAFRLFYQSSASNSPLGFPPHWLVDDGVPFDLALLCAANYSHVRGYPQDVLAYLHPRQVLLIHWEKFWDDYSTTQATPLPGMDFAELEQRIRAVLGDQVPVRLMNRGGAFQLERAASTHNVPRT